MCIRDRVEGLTYDTTTLNSRIDTRADNRIEANAIAITSVQTAANETAHLALTTQEGDVVVRTDQSKSYVKNSGTAGTMADFTELLAPTDAVASVGGYTGAITALQLVNVIDNYTINSNAFTNATSSTTPPLAALTNPAPFFILFNILDISFSVESPVPEGLSAFTLILP